MWHVISSSHLPTNLGKENDFKTILVQKNGKDVRPPTAVSRMLGHDGAPWLQDFVGVLHTWVSNDKRVFARVKGCFYYWKAPNNVVTPRFWGTERAGYVGTKFLGAFGGLVGSRFINRFHTAVDLEENMIMRAAWWYPQMHLSFRLTSDSSCLGSISVWIVWFD